MANSDNAVSWVRATPQYIRMETFEGPSTYSATSSIAEETFSTTSTSSSEVSLKRNRVSAQPPPGRISRAFLSGSNKQVHLELPDNLDEVASQLEMEESSIPESAAALQQQQMDERNADLEDAAHHPETLPFTPGPGLGLQPPKVRLTLPPKGWGSVGEKKMLKFRKALLTGDVDKVKSIAKKNPDIVNGCQKMYLRPLELAKLARKNKQDMMKILLSSKKINVNVIDKNGNTLLHRACLVDDMEFAKVLLQNGAEPVRGAANKIDFLPWQIATFFNNEPLAKVVAPPYTDLTSGPQPIKDYYGLTPPARRPDIDYGIRQTTRKEKDIANPETWLDYDTIKKSLDHIVADHNRMDVWVAPGPTDMKRKFGKLSKTNLRKAIEGFHKIPDPAPRFLASTVAVEAEHGTHAGLLIVDREKRTVEYYDSAGNRPDVSAELAETAFDLGYTFHEMPTQDMQGSQPSCGVYLNLFLHHRLQNADEEIGVIKENLQGMNTIAEGNPEQEQIYINLYRQQLHDNVAEVNQLNNKWMAEARGQFAHKPLSNPPTFEAAFERFKQENPYNYESELNRMHRYGVTLYKYFEARNVARGEKYTEYLMDNPKTVEYFRDTVEIIGNKEAFDYYNNILNEGTSQPTGLAHPNLLDEPVAPANLHPPLQPQTQPTGLAPPNLVDNPVPPANLHPPLQPQKMDTAEVQRSSADVENQDIDAKVEKLFEYIDSGNVEEIKKLLDENPNAQLRIVNGFPNHSGKPLELAKEVGKRDVIDLLEAYDASPLRHSIVSDKGEEPPVQGPATRKGKEKVTSQGTSPQAEEIETPPPLPPREQTKEVEEPLSLPLIFETAVPKLTQIFESGKLLPTEGSKKSDQAFEEAKKDLKNRFDELKESIKNFQGKRNEENGKRNEENGLAALNQIKKLSEALRTTVEAKKGPGSIRNLFTRKTSSKRKLEKQNIRRDAAKILRSLNRSVLNTTNIDPSKSENMGKINLENAKKTVKQFVDTEKNLSESLKTYRSILRTLKTNESITQDQFNILSEGLDDIIKNSDSLLSSLAPLDKKDPNDLPDNFINLVTEKIDNSMQEKITFPMISYWARYENTILPLIQSLEGNDETKKIIYEELTKRKLGVKGLNHFASMPWQRLTRYKDLIERIASESGSNELKQRTEFQKLLVRFGNTEIALEELAPPSQADKSVEASSSQVEDIESDWVDLIESNRKNASENLADALKPRRDAFILPAMLKVVTRKMMNSVF